MLTQRLRHRITVQQQTNEQDSTTGENSVAWSDVLADEPAEVIPVSAREFRESGRKQGETTGRMTIRKPTFDIDGTTMRILWQGKPYQIDGALPDPSDRRWLTIVYSQGVNDGQ